MTVSDFIGGLGGNSQVAALTGRKAGAVAVWVYRRKIPRTAWPELIKAFPSLTLEQLLELERQAQASVSA